MKPVIAIPAIIALLYRAWSRNSLTPVGIFAAFATAVAHAVHPWSVFFALLGTFFIAGTAVTKVKHEVKARLTQSATGSGGEGPRNHIQVVANSLAASILILLHAWVLSQAPRSRSFSREECWRRGSDVLVIGIVANYAAVASDTFSSELGILSTTSPRLITAPWKTVPKGTNGGVTVAGLLAGLGGSFLISAVSAALIPWCVRPDDKVFDQLDAVTLVKRIEEYWTLEQRVQYVIAMTIAGFCGTLLDSFLGALLQASVVDTHTGRIVEGDGGRKVLVHPGDSTQKKHAQVRGDIGKAVAETTALGNKKEHDTIAAPGGQETRKIEVGSDILDNNAVNFLMAATISVGAMTAAALLWGIPLDVESILS